MTLPYSKKVMKHFTHPKNVGELKNPDGVGEVGNMKCGDIMKIGIKVDNKEVIKDIKFKTFGCSAAVASTSALTELVKGKNINNAKKITMKKVAEHLGGLPNIKLHCSSMAVNALKKAIQDYEKKNKK
ncbi:MAG: iron-sulfur cluster assembly scaffold protein [Nanoarchaeota archaeon]